MQFASIGSSSPFCSFCSESIFKEPSGDRPLTPRLVLQRVALRIDQRPRFPLNCITPCKTVKLQVLQVLEVCPSKKVRYSPYCRSSRNARCSIIHSHARQWIGLDLLFSLLRLSLAPLTAVQVKWWNLPGRLVEFAGKIGWWHQYVERKWDYVVLDLHAL